ncbi:Heterokaryon incompatibility protein (HET) domain containing protein [Rhypophila decipiens]
MFWGHLRCTLMTVSMDEHLPPFEALSYRWGFSKIPGQTELIVIDGRPMVIPGSAYQLLHARSSVFTDKLVWIDAICINQTDVEEKSRQLPLKKDIYSKANKVTVWPGDKWDSGMAMGIMRRVFSAIVMYQAPEEEIRDLFEDEWDRRAWKAMLKLLKNSYFTRMWVIQEIVRGLDVEIYHGGHSMPWEAFALVVEKCMHPRWRTALYGPRQQTSPAPTRALTEAAMGVDLMSLFRVEAEEKMLGAFHIGHLLAATAKSQATDPRDKVFALSGLLSNHHALLESLLDYSKSATEVFLETAKTVLKQERDPYALFGFAGIGWESNLSDLPSWAQQEPLPVCRRPSIRMHTDGTPCVVVRGTITDRVAKDVKAVGQSVMPEATATSFQFSRDRSDWYLQAKALLEEGQQTYPHTGQLLEEAFWRTIVADRSGLKRPAPAYFEACNRVYEKLSGVRVKAYPDKPKEPLCIGDYPELRDIWPTKLDAEAEFYEFLHAIPRSAEHRKFIVGEHGFLGLAPPLTKVGDLICLLDGGPTPFILREHEDKSGPFTGCYYLVGECYVHGLRTGAGVNQRSTMFIIT